MIRIYKTSEVINFTLEKLMKKNKNIVCFGLGVDDPKSIFNTTKNLQKSLENIEFLIRQHQKML